MKITGSNPVGSAIAGASPSGSKAPDFDSGYRWFESSRAYQTDRSASREGLLLITANRTVRNRYERPFPSGLVYQLGRLLVEQENTGQHRGPGPIQGVKLKWTSAGLQNQRLQVRGLVLPPFFLRHEEWLSRPASRQGERDRPEQAFQKRVNERRICAWHLRLIPPSA